MEVATKLNTALENGVTLITGETAFVFHVYEFAPDAVNITGVPEHIIVEGEALIITVGVGVTVTVTGVILVVPQPDVSLT